MKYILMTLFLLNSFMNLLAQKYEEKDIIGEYDMSLLDDIRPALKILENNYFVFYKAYSLNPNPTACVGRWYLKNDSVYFTSFKSSQNDSLINFLIKQKGKLKKNISLKISDIGGISIEGVCGTLLNENKNIIGKSKADHNGIITFPIDSIGKYRVLLVHPKYSILYFDMNTDKYNNFELNLLPRTHTKMELFDNKQYYIDDRFRMFDIILKHKEISIFKHK